MTSMSLIMSYLASSNRVKRHWNLETFQGFHVSPTFQRTETEKVIKNKRVKYQVSRFPLSPGGQALTMGWLLRVDPRRRVVACVVGTPWTPVKGKNSQ